MADGEGKRLEKRLCRVKDRSSGQCLAVASVWAFWALWDKKQAYYDAKVGMLEIVMHQIHTIMSVLIFTLKSKRHILRFSVGQGGKAFSASCLARLTNRSRRCCLDNKACQTFLSYKVESMNWFREALNYLFLFCFCGDLVENELR